MAEPKWSILLDHAEAAVKAGRTEMRVDPEVLLRVLRGYIYLDTQIGVIAQGLGDEGENTLQQIRYHLKSIGEQDG